MNAIQFIQDYGIDKARAVVAGQKDTVAPNLFKFFCPAINDYHMMNIESNVRIEDIKRLVDSVNLVNKYHSLEHAKDHYNNLREAINQYKYQYEKKDVEDLSQELGKAITDYESIYGVAE